MKAYALNKSSRFVHVLTFTKLNYVIRSTLRSDVHKSSKQASSNEQRAIQERRHRLIKQIDAFHEKASLLGLGEGSMRSNLGFVSEFEGESQSDRSEVGDDTHNSEDEDGKQLDATPENAVIQLPSSLEPGTLEAGGFLALANQELELRKGQANDILERLRLLLGHKAILFRTDVCDAPPLTYNILINNLPIGQTCMWHQEYIKGMEKC
jgi:hypothetical protein